VKTKVAIIGSSSFIAEYIIKALLKEENKYDITLFGRNHGSSPFKLKFKYFDHPHFTLKFKDLLNFNKIIYLAGAGIQQKKDSQQSIFEVNTFLPIQLFNFLKENNFKGLFISFGSYWEIGSNNSERTFSEQEIINTSFIANSDYINSKRLLTRYFSLQPSDLPFLHFILPTVYGPGENKRRLIPYLIDSICSSQTPQLTNGEQVRQYLNVADLSDFIVTIDTKSYGIYNCPASETSSVKDLVVRIYNHFQIKIPSVFGKMQRYDSSMKYLQLQTKRFETNFSWRPTTKVIDTLDKYLN
jgi:nucleoside-diphosphate-sugar epimerase